MGGGVWSLRRRRRWQGFSQMELEMRERESEGKGQENLMGTVGQGCGAGVRYAAQTSLIFFRGPSLVVVVAARVVAPQSGKGGKGPLFL